MMSNNSSPFISREMFSGLDLVKKVNQACDNKCESQRNLVQEPQVKKSTIRIKSAVFKSAIVKLPSMDKTDNISPFILKKKDNSPVIDEVVNSEKMLFFKKKLKGDTVYNSQDNGKRVFVLPNGKKFFDFSRKKDE